jgi:hypothetical protein
MLSHAHRDGLRRSRRNRRRVDPQDDAVARADQLCAGLGLDAASPAHRDLQSAYRQCWDELMRFADAGFDILDRDGDGVISRAEIVDAMRDLFYNATTPEAPGDRVLR